jgi:hypothetical protein
LTRFAPCGQRHWCRRFDRRTLRIGTPAAFGRSAQDAALFLFFCILLNGCRSPHAASTPSIEFTRVPPATEGGQDKIDVIEGRVTDPRPGQQIVLYAKSGTWWVQPLVNEPFTRVNADATWTNATHVGTEYAALLVEPGYKPQTTLSTEPAVGGGVAAVAVAKGGSSGPWITQTLFFSGYEWRIRNAPSDRGGHNNYDSSNAWTDSDSALHLRIAKVFGKWTCAEVTLTRSLGYGTYSFVVRDTTQLEPAAIFSIFTWDYAGNEQYHREMDIEVSRWGDPTNKNAEYVVQPFYLAENVSQFRLPAGVVTHSFRWEPGRVSFRTVQGTRANSGISPVAEHVFTSGVPSAGIESARMSLYMHGGEKAPLQNGAEVVIEKFEYLP